ncbi:Cyclin-dependent kinase 10 [Thelohanellus kitauei]|uniref:Cyclin-dependent kinase 10 n=1 Tax=Thelohanellus kitauei TaxID=669202 RepID=A0A0C2I8B5_THEKT|nr:Cyclin-dependent kinase 10 [Thelohanellus kitauei]
MKPLEFHYLVDPSKKWSVNVGSLRESSRNEGDFEKLNIIGEGTYGVVYRVKDKKTGEITALKSVKMHHKHAGFPVSSIREIRILQQAKHPNIVGLREVVMGDSIDSIFLNMDYCEHDLATLIQHLPAPFSEPQIKNVALQIVQGLHFLHSHYIIHRDMKLSNILMNSYGSIKIADFGLARPFTYPYKPMTPIVVTLWYRPPELLFGSDVHTPMIDMWGVGCIVAELYKNKPLFMGDTEISQILLIVETLGTPNDDIWEGFTSLPGAKSLNLPHQPYNTIREKFQGASSDEGIGFLQGLLVYDPLKRLTSKKCLDHKYFTTDPLPIDPDLMPTFPEFRNLKSKVIKKR